jgi:hypothetical protein
MRAYAAATSGTASYEKIRRAAIGRDEPLVSRNAAAPYREVLQRLFQLDPVPAWAPSMSHLNRVTLPDKHPLADPALAARLLRVGAADLLQGTAARTESPSSPPRCSGPDAPTGLPFLDRPGRRAHWRDGGQPLAAQTASP